MQFMFLAFLQAFEWYCAFPHMGGGGGGGGGKKRRKTIPTNADSDATMTSPAVAESSAAPPAAFIIAQPSSTQAAALTAKVEQRAHLYDESIISAQVVAELEQCAREANNWLSPVTLFEGVNLHTSKQYVLSPNCHGAFAPAKAAREPWITDQDTHEKRLADVFRIVDDIHALLNRVFKVGDGSLCSIRNRTW